MKTYTEEQKYSVLDVAMRDQRHVGIIYKGIYRVIIPIEVNSDKIVANQFMPEFGKRVFVMSKILIDMENYEPLRNQPQQSP